MINYDQSTWKNLILSLQRLRTQIDHLKISLTYSVHQYGIAVAQFEPPWSNSYDYECEVSAHPSQESTATYWLVPMRQQYVVHASREQDVLFL